MKPSRLATKGADTPRLVRLFTRRNTTPVPIIIEPTVPRPPDRLTPPVTTAASAVISRPTPVVEPMLFSREA